MHKKLCIKTSGAQKHVQRQGSKVAYFKCKRKEMIGRYFYPLPCRRPFGGTYPLMGDPFMWARYGPGGAIFVRKNSPSRLLRIHEIRP
jgi:hypothetical protein